MKGLIVFAATMILALGGISRAEDKTPSPAPAASVPWTGDHRDKVTFATNWLAEAEHGGFYEALADGTYALYGLDVTILQGGPQANNRLLLAAGKAEFNLGANLIEAFDAVEGQVPIVAVAALFQKDPVILMSHPGQGRDRFEDLPQAKAFIGREALASLYQWLRTAHGFREENVRPYLFNSGPFLADKSSIQQGYVTSEPFEIERQGHFKPNVFLLADYGYDSYSTTIEVRRDLIDKKPDLVRRFVEASIIGWYHYIYGDNKAANALIKQDNPEISDEQLAYSLAQLKERGIVDSGDALHLGIGTMSDARVKSFFDKMVQAGLYKPTLDYKQAYTLQFVNHGVGLGLRPKSP
ncbi:ABC transporter substrate-binding protein [Beijerinckia indica]|uniref:NMT1/THI5 like domain protein n=1 Tax=Beijerinckia indica subsp. indica (strain ATCC 9039 / DSM 1715 / NCIMB 8712) TaxID=395963 RepID=B2IIN8_BEII9|nr:ABC transporter substrate-binding protein [Beijerinckia indica]ACB94731.1 NMT1/THI5 like domain protein [Beijerinckia indica subsp. indica ATCC 9039]